MLTISEEQIQVLQKESAESYLRTMVVYLTELAPEHAEAAGEPAMLEFVRTARKHALKWNVTQRDTTRFWLEYSMLWGIDFATDPQYEFARQCLAGDDPELLRMRRLHRAALTFNRACYGEFQEHFRAALATVKDVRLDKSLDQSPGSDDHIRQRLFQIWPQKCEVIGEAAIAAFIVECHEATTTHRLDAGAGPLIVCILGFLMGVGCLDDPQFPWLRHKSDLEGPEAVESLYRRARIYLEATLANA